METTKISPREQLLRDTLCTCIEGGSNYWLRGQAQRKDDPSDVVGFYYTGITNCCDAEDSTEKFDNITLATIELGFRRIMDMDMENRILIAPSIRMSVIEAWMRPEDGDIDADAADCILQAGLFGSLVYG